MGITVRGQTGPQALQDGTEQPVRQGKTGELVLTQLHGKYYEQVARGNVWTATVGVAGQDLASSTATALTGLILYNPTNSGKNMSLIKTTLGSASGAQVGSVGSIVYAVSTGQQVVPATATALTPACNLVGSPNRPVGAAYSSGTVATQLVNLRPAFATTAYTTGAAMAPAWNIVDYVNGDIVIGPGGVCAVVGGATGAGTDGMGGQCLVACTWEEVNA